jgi:hypothetical protein
MCTSIQVKAVGKVTSLHGWKSFDCKPVALWTWGCGGEEEEEVVVL